MTAASVKRPELAEWPAGIGQLVAELLEAERSAALARLARDQFGLTEARKRRSRLLFEIERLKLEAMVGDGLDGIGGGNARQTDGNSRSA